MEQNKRLSSDQKVIISTGFIFIIIVSSALAFSLPVLIFQIIFVTFTLFFCCKTDYKTAKLWLSIFGIAMSFVFLVYLANKIYYGKPYYIGGSDDLNFEKWGFDVYNFGVYNPAKIMEFGVIGQFNNSPFFPVYIAKLIQFSEFFGSYTTFLPRILNVYYLIWICMSTKKLLENYTSLSKKAIYYSLVVFGFMPNVLYINAHVFRDMFNLLQVLLVAILFDSLLNQDKPMLKIASTLLLVPLLYSTYYTRASSILFALVLILLMFSSKYQIKNRFIFILIIPMLFLSNLLETFRLGYYIETYSSYVSEIAGEGLSGFVFNRPMLPFGIFFRAIYALISPFPNFFGLFNESSKFLFDLVQFTIYVGVLLQILAIPFIIKRALKFDWLSIVFLSLFFTVIATTFTFRHVLIYYPFMAAIGIDGFLETKPNTRKVILVMSVLVSICLGIIYLFLRLF